MTAILPNINSVIGQQCSQMFKNWVLQSLKLVILTLTPSSNTHRFKLGDVFDKHFSIPFPVSIGHSATPPHTNTRVFHHSILAVQYFLCMLYGTQILMLVIWYFNFDTQMLLLKFYHSIIVAQIKPLFLTLFLKQV